MAKALPRKRGLFGVGEAHDDLADLARRVDESDALQQALSAGEILVEIPVDRIDRSPYQARLEVDEAGVADLAEDIGEHGINNPITVRRADGDRYELVAGERRWRAVQRAGKGTVLARVRTLDDFEAHLVAVSENNQRAGLSEYEAALEVQALEMHARAAGRPATQKDLARYFARNVQVINHQLQIARSVTPDVLNTAGMVVSEIAGLPRDTLLRIAKEPAAARARALREAVRLRKLTRRGGEEAASASTSPAAEGALPGGSPADSARTVSEADDTWRRYWERGGLQFTIRRPLRDLAPRRAARYLEDYLPGVLGLARRASDGRGVHSFTHPEGELLYLPPESSMDDAQRKQACAELEARLQKLRSGR